MFQYVLKLFNLTINCFTGTGSIPRLRDQDDWPDPPTGTEDGSLSPFSDSSHWDSSANKLDDSNFLPPELSSSDLSVSGTYVIRKGRRKERTPVQNIETKQTNRRQHHSKNSPKQADLKRCSSTFDNIKSLLKEGLIEGLDDAPPDFQPPTPPSIVRVVSLPTLTIDETIENVVVNERLQESSVPPESQRHKDVILHDVGIQVMDDLQSTNLLEKYTESVEESTQVSLKYRDVSQGSSEQAEELLLRLDKSENRTDNALIITEESLNTRTEETLPTPLEVTNIEVATELVTEDPWLMATEISEIQVVPVVEDESEKPPGDFKVMVEVLQHEFGPLPPSPVEEDDDEYSDILRGSPAPTPRNNTEGAPEPFYRCLEPPGSDPIGARFLNRPCPPEPTIHREPTSSLKTRSMDAGFSRNHKNQHSGSRRDVSILLFSIRQSCYTG